MSKESILGQIRPQGSVAAQSGIPPDSRSTVSSIPPLVGTSSVSSTGPVSTGYSGSKNGSDTTTAVGSWAGHGYNRKRHSHKKRRTKRRHNKKRQTKRRR